MSDIVLFIDPRLKSYESFWDGEWAGNLHELVKKTPLVDAFDDLLVAWKRAADVHGQPWLTMETMKAFAKGLTEGYEPFCNPLCQNGFRLHSQQGSLGIQKMEANPHRIKCNASRYEGCKCKKHKTGVFG